MRKVNLSLGGCCYASCQAFPSNGARSRQPIGLSRLRRAYRRYRTRFLAFFWRWAGWRLRRLDRKKVILAFRGSTFSQGNHDTLTWLDKAFTDWTAHFSLHLKQYHSGLVQGNYLDAIRLAWPEISRLLRYDGAADKKLWITGHSLGGALAALAGAMCHWDNGVKVAGVYTYGSPRLADTAFAGNYPVPLLRFENRNDIFPHLPPQPSVMRLLRVLSSDIEDALDRWFGSDFLNRNYVPLGQLQFLDKKARIHDEVDDQERIVGIITALVYDQGQLLQDHWIDSYCAAISYA